MLMTFGQYKNQPMDKIPVDYLLSLYTQKELMKQHPTVNDYIESTYASILPTGPIRTLMPDPICDTGKICYVDEEAAKKALKLIKQDKRQHIKPHRSYLCERCGFWHHTSKELKE